MKKKIKGLLFAGAALAAFAFSSQTAEAASGIVHIQEGNNKMVGMWVHVEGGGSGWAKWHHIGGNRYRWSYDTRGRKWTADVGVNGTPQSWTINARGFNWTYANGNNIDVWANQGGHYGWRTVVPR